MAQILSAEIVGIRTAETGSGGFYTNSTDYSVLVFYSDGNVALIEGDKNAIRPYLGYMRPKNDAYYMKQFLDDFEARIKNDLKTALEQALFKSETSRDPVPNIIGKSRKEARRMLEEAGFICSEAVPDNSVGGIVEGFDRNHENTKLIKVKVKYSYPPVIGKSAAEATAILVAMGFSPIINEAIVSDYSMEGKVVSLSARDENRVALFIGKRNNAFMEQIRLDTSMMTIWKKWEASGYAAKFPKTDALIKKQKDIERMYGKLSNIEQVKSEIEKSLKGN